jgi:glycosyltransferase involved in cell wall biosynthesis
MAKQELRLLFVSGVSVGGAARSTLELASVLGERGHDVRVLLGNAPDDRREALFNLGVNAWFKSDGRAGSRMLLRLLRVPGRRLQARPASPSLVSVHTTRHPENAYRRVLAEQRPDAVIVNSVSRAAWRWICEDLQQRRIPSVLYVREAHAITHLTVTGTPPDLLLANAAAHGDELEAAGHPALVLPSIVDRRAAAVTSSRSRALLVNPVGENHVDLLLEVARLRPDIPLVLQESWPLEEPYRSELAAAVDGLPNVELRPRVPDPRTVYRDARVVLATYPSGRPRVIAEAQHNGIPVLAVDRPALAEAVGPGGVLVPVGASPAEWAEALGSIWDDAERYAELSAQARAHDARPEIDGQHIAEAFEAAIKTVVTR